MTESMRKRIAAAFPDSRTARFPNIVNVEVFRGACPCRCVHCPVGRTDPAERQRRFGREAIDLALYTKIVEEVARYPWATLRLHSVGEPILWDDLVDALRIAERHNVRTWLFTSGVTSDVRLLEAVADSATVVEVSVNSTTPVDYINTKGIDRFAQVVDNIRHLSMQRGGARARLLATRTQTGHPDMDREFVEFWQASGLVDDAFVRSYHSYNGLLDERQPAAAAVTPPCLVHWARFNISHAGHAIVCFNELFKPSLDSRLVLGDVRREDIATIWAGPELNDIRAAALAGNYDALPTGRALPCRECSSCQPLFGHRQTSEHQIAQLEKSPG